MNSVFAPSEIAPLRKVIVHKPDDGISRISPKRSDDLLFDDIVFLPKMKREHAIFVEVLETFLGKENVLEAEDLIFEALETGPEGRKEILDLIIDFEELPTAFGADLQKLDNRALAQVLISGYIKETNDILFDPIPNFIFTRDVGVVVNDHIIITKAAKEARHRENLLTRFVFWYHPMFQHLQKEGRAINLNKRDQFPRSRRGESVSIEGGDMMILNEDYFLIGCSERSTLHAFNSLKKVLFEKKIVKNVVLVKIPNERSFMHIDTLFTHINHSHVVAYKPVVVDGMSSFVEVHTRTGSVRKYSSIKEFFIGEIDPDMMFILGGNGTSPYQEREQWTDGCNLVAIRPGIALTYDRNLRTEIAFRNAGYTVLHATEFLEKTSKDPDFHKSLENTIITLPSAELSRARGGTHCMTLPILRTYEPA